MKSLIRKIFQQKKVGLTILVLFFLFIVAISYTLFGINHPIKPRDYATKTSSGVGQSIYDTYCSGCHTLGAGGAPKLGDPNSWKPRLKKGTEKVYQQTLQGYGGMPAKGTCTSCTESEIKQAVDYMIAATQNSTGEKTQPHEKNHDLW